MFEPEELMARIVDLEEQLKVSEMAPPAAEQLIACLEGEIAKRDEELAACRVAVENCEVFRARIAELERELGNSRVSLKDSDAGLLSFMDQCKQLRAELAAIKAQEPVAWAGAIEYGVPLLMVEPQNWKATPLYAAPVSEAKAQGVVMPEGWIPLTIEHEPGYPEDVAFGPKRMMDRLKRWLDRYFEMRLAAAPAAPAADAGLCEALEKLARLGNGDKYGNSDGNLIAQAALAAHRARGVV